MPPTQSDINYLYAPMDIQEIPLGRWHPVTKFLPFGREKITMIINDSIQVILPKNITGWAQRNPEEFLKLQSESQNYMLFFVVERNFIDDYRIHFKRISDSLLFAWETSKAEDSDDDSDTS
ncbi:hypothetical protein QAD02_007836 [Eretmocerus hayati]|uniref:Uncharacterized protein n=1 Tax=Eretmocerus hayati TaxID=131215 RepID=A0ACC2N4S0_9HYME|nr:hypothetical protein QAD02_007836 [Eretmocerus hayati]